MSDRCPFVLPDSRRCTEKSGHIVSHRWISDEEANWRQMSDTIEKMAAEFHDIYQQEAKRQGDVRHKDAYADLPENVKEFDRVPARHVAAGIAEAVKAAEEATYSVAYQVAYQQAISDVEKHQPRIAGAGIDPKYHWICSCGFLGNWDEGQTWERHIASLIPLSPRELVDRYVASKVREAKIAIAQEAQDWFGDHAMMHCEIRDNERCDWCRRIAELVAAERKEHGQ